MSATSSKRVLVNKDFILDNGNGGVPLTSEDKPREEVLHTSQDILAFNSISKCACSPQTPSFMFFSASAIAEARGSRQVTP